ncbi:MAG: nucleotidyltransferase family protein [Paludibacteraceae bacterium]|nr:nucleotidyltransferase family protein [Paludibacteraceae bacterium]
MNRQETKIFFDLLRNALFATPIPTETWTEKWSWKPVLKAVEDHVLQTLVTEPLMALPDKVKPGFDVLSRYMQYVALNMQEHVRLNKDLVKVFSLLEQEGYKPVLMKGQGNATFYRNPMLRKCGDIDIFIGKNRYEESCTYILSALQDTKVVKDELKHLEFTWGKTEVEMHRYAEIECPPQNDAAYQALIEKYMYKPDVVAIDSASISIPPAQFNALYVFNHMWNHFKMGGVGFRQFADIATILHATAGKYDVEQLGKDLKAVGLMLEWKVVGGVIVDLMGLPENEYPFYEKMPIEKSYAMADLVLNDGNFAKNRNDLLQRQEGRSEFVHILCYLYMHFKRCYLLSKASFRLGLRTLAATLKRGSMKMIKGEDD